MIQFSFIQESDPGARFISWWTWSNFNHVDIITPKGHLGARTDGVKIRQPGYMGSYLKSWCVGVVGCDDQTRDKIFEFAYAQVGKSYDWLDLLGIACHQDWEERNTWICSALGIAAASAGGLKLLNTDKFNRVSPYELSLSPLVNLGPVQYGEKK